MEIEVTGKQLAHLVDVSEMPDLAFLRDEKLNHSATFRDLRTQVENHFQKSHTMHLEKSPKWKNVLYTSLLTSLREVAFTTDSEEQKKLLKSVHAWYRNKTNRPSVSAARVPQKPPVAFNSSFAFLDKQLRKAQTLKPIEARSLSPVKLTRPAAPRIPTPRSVEMYHPFAKTIAMVPLDEEVIMQRLHDFQQHRLKELRSAVIEKKQLAGWGKYRSRVEENSVFCTEHRIRETPRIVSELAREARNSPSPLLVDLRNETRSITPSSVTVESATDRVSKFRQRHADLLNVPDESPARRSTAASLSFYSKHREENSVEIRRQPTPSHTPFLPGSENKPDQPASLSPTRRAKLEEVLEVKRRLALANLPCTYRILKQGLLEPDELPPAKLTPDSLPQGGELMQSNPFFSVGKKKKLKRRR